MSHDDLDDVVSLDALELLDSCESFDFFEFMLPLSDTLLLLLDEHFDDLTLWAASLSQQCTFLLKEHTWVSTSSNQLSSLPLSSSPNNWLYSWCASNNILKRSLNCFISSSTAILFWLENSPQWCCTFWSICHWSSFSSLWESLFCMVNPSQWGFYILLLYLYYHVKWCLPLHSAQPIVSMNCHQAHSMSLWSWSKFHDVDPHWPSLTDIL